jgi:hypothetical protein
MTTAPEGRGGYRQPNNPAPVSGPGALSQRTDGGAIDGMQQPMQQPMMAPQSMMQEMPHAPDSGTNMPGPPREPTVSAKEQALIDYWK